MKAHTAAYPDEENPKSESRFFSTLGMHCKLEVTALQDKSWGPTLMSSEARLPGFDFQLLPFTNCVASDKLLNFSINQELICKMEIIIIASFSWFSLREKISHIENMAI